MAEKMTKKEFKAYMKRRKKQRRIVLFAGGIAAVVLVICALAMAGVFGGKNKDDTSKKTPTSAPSSAPTGSATPGTEPKDSVTPTQEATPTPTPTPGNTPTPTPTPYAFGLCSSVTLDVDSEPIDGDNWEIDYLMLVNWTHRLVYKGNPENLVRLDDVLNADFYKIEDPYTVAEKSRNFVIETEEDRYDRGNKVALEHLDEMCKAYHEATGHGVKVSQTGAYRNYATQDRFWNNRDKSLNPPRTIPGNASEHRTGLGFDIWVLDGEKYDYKWFQKNCADYGFVLRYPENKKKITGITGEQWHYRYVGVEAAKEMQELGYCLEEYIAYKNGEDLASLPKY